MSDRNKFIEVDRNMLIETSINEPDIKFYDVREDPFEIYGLYDPKGQDVFKRLPDEIGQNVNSGVKRLYLHTAGGRVRFSTDSKYVAIKCIMPYITRYSHMAMTATSGFDLFIDSEAGSRFHRPFKPDVNMEGGYESVLKFATREMRYFTINFPSYNPVDTLYIGLQQDAKVGEGKKYRSPLPIYYYGNSITQGACATRPGGAYPSIISRRMNLDFVNLGFSGSGRAEDLIANYMAEQKMLAFVCDYDHNAPDVEYLARTHCRLYKTFRAKNPDVPYIMISRPDYDNNVEESILRRNVIIDTYRYARESGDKNVWYIDGQGIFRGPDVDVCSVDGAHPSDVGFLKIADAVERILVRALRHDLG